MSKGRLEAFSDGVLAIIIARALGDDFKGKISVVIYAAAILLALYLPALAGALYVAVALMWLVPDRRIEKALAE